MLSRGKLFKVPAVLLTTKDYTLTSVDLIVYSLLLDRWQLSQDNGWKDKQGGQANGDGK